MVVEFASHLVAKFDSWDSHACWCYEHCFSTLLVVGWSRQDIENHMEPFKILYYDIHSLEVVRSWSWSHCLNFIGSLMLKKNFFILYMKFVSRFYGNTIWHQPLDATLEDNYLHLSSMTSFLKCMKWAKIAMVYVRGYGKNEGWFSSLSFVKSKLGNALDLHLPLCLLAYTLKNIHLWEIIIWCNIWFLNGSGMEILWLKLGWCSLPFMQTHVEWHQLWLLHYPFDVHFRGKHFLAYFIYLIIKISHS